MSLMPTTSYCRVRRMSGRRTGIIVMITSTSMVAVFVIFMIFGPRLHSAVIHDSNAADEASADRTSFRSRQKQQLQPASGLPFLTLRSEPKDDQGLSDISSLWWNITKSESSDENKRELQSLGSSSGAFQEKCRSDPTAGYECLSCLQWDCPFNFYAKELPYCFSYTWAPNDDYRPERDVLVEECSRSTCCASDETWVNSCKGYDCPKGTESLLVPCTTVPGSAPYFPCEEKVCCGDACTPNPCGDNAVCEGSATFAYCYCEPGYENTGSSSWGFAGGNFACTPIAPVSECSNGLEGFEGQNDNGVACCAIWCNGCGGTGCGAAGAAGIASLDITSCCINGVLNTQELCSVTGKAPCRVDEEPTPAPTPAPTEIPTPSPTTTPTPTPTEAPTPAPTETPTPAPSPAPTPAPTPTPTPTPTEAPTPAPTETPTPGPSPAPTPGPTPAPTPAPTPTPTPTPTEAPTPAPTEIPTPGPSPAPTPGPTPAPTPAPTPTPTPTPTEAPTPAPTEIPTPGPSPAPTPGPTPAPTPAPTPTPTPPPTEAPTPAPTETPTETPASGPSPAPTPTPTEAPTPGPSPAPTPTPTPAPTPTPTEAPTPTPTTALTEVPATPSPIRAPTSPPTRSPSPSPSPRTHPTPVDSSSVKPTAAGAIVTVPTSTPSNAPSSPPDGEPASGEDPTETAGLPPNTVSEVVVPGTITAGTVSVFAWSGLAAVVVGGVVGGASGSSATGAAASSAPSGVERAGAADAATTPGAASVRPPSVTLAILLITQIQFLATLSLVDSTGANDSLLSELARNLRWVNLWPPASVGRSFLARSGLEAVSDGDDGEHGESPGCVFAATSLSDIGGDVFFGNIALFTAILAGIFIVHIFVVSGVETAWILKQRAREEIAKAGRCGVLVRGMTARRSGRVEHADDDDEFDITPDDGDDDDVDRAEDGTPVPPPARPKTLRALLLEFRDRPRSALLYFPHVELLFLLFAFEGAVASQLGAILERNCPWVLYVASTALVVYPILMVLLCFRTFRVRVIPDTLVVFKPKEWAADEYDRAAGGGTPGFFSRVRTSMREDKRLFAWADSGAWRTAETADVDTRREGDQFRIGFEPLFVDFEKTTAWFMVYSLVEMVAIASVAVLVDDSATQLFSFCGLHTVSFLLLVFFKPFANSVINTLGACLLLVDASCMAMLADNVLRWEGTSRAKRLDTAVTIIQLVALVVLILPIYADSSVAITGAIQQKIKQMAKDDEAEVNEQVKDEERFIRRYVLRRWPVTLCRMLGRNLFACVRDTTKGVRQATTAARTGPCLDMNPSTTSTPSAAIFVENT